MSFWIDTDLALGAPAGDVDDGFALAALLVDPEVEVLGISTVSGNTDAETARRCAQGLLTVAGRQLEICEPAGAARRIAGLPTGTKLLAFGPLSNVAAALVLDPTLPARVELSVVATVRQPWRFPLLRFYCLNSKADRQAADVVNAQAWAGRRVFPLDVVQRLRFGSADLDRLAATSPLGAYLAHHARRWLQQAWWRYRGRDFPVWDLVAALAAAGRLPGAQCDEQGRLESFDAERAKTSFYELMVLTAGSAQRRRHQA